MGIANKLTLFRILIVPLFVFFMLMENKIEYNFLWAVFVFAVASLTDMLDGFVARKYKQISDFGKILDPLADKILIVSAFICLLHIKLVNVIVVLIVVIREFLITSFRMFAQQKQIIISADILGKIKTVCQMVFILFTLISKELIAFKTIKADAILNFWASGLAWAVSIFTILSAVNYIFANMDLLYNLDMKGN